MHAIRPAFLHKPAFNQRDERRVVGFPARAEEGFAQERTALQSKIGELTIQVDFLAKKSKQLGL